MLLKSKTDRQEVSMATNEMLVMGKGLSYELWGRLHKQSHYSVLSCSMTH